MQELGIIIAIVVGVIWLLFKLVEGVANAADRAMKDHNAASAKRKQNRFATERDRRRQYVYFLLPNELDSLEKKLTATRIEFQHTQKATNWIARPPTWRKR